MSVTHIVASELRGADTDHPCKVGTTYVLAITVTPAPDRVTSETFDGAVVVHGSGVTIEPHYQEMKVGEKVASLECRVTPDREGKFVLVVDFLCNGSWVLRRTHSGESVA
ncbi:MAG: hypothetical protein HY455_03165 [Parcubacteria group bacterium]|nr:hypothetical protein [Parcubacteria group bacterium]